MENNNNQNSKSLNARDFKASFGKDPTLKFSPEQIEAAAERQRQIFEKEFPELFNSSKDKLAAFKQDLEAGIVVPPTVRHQTLTRKRKKN